MLAIRTFTNRQGGKQTDSYTRKEKTDGQTYIKTGRWKDRQTDQQKDRQIDRQVDRQVQFGELSMGCRTLCDSIG